MVRGRGRGMYQPSALEYSVWRCAKAPSEFWVSAMRDSPGEGWG